MKHKRLITVGIEVSADMDSESVLAHLDKVHNEVQRACTRIYEDKSLRKATDERSGLERPVQIRAWCDYHPKNSHEMRDIDHTLDSEHQPHAFFGVRGCTSLRVGTSGLIVRNQGTDGLTLSVFDDSTNSVADVTVPVEAENLRPVRSAILILARAIAKSGGSRGQ